jgi:MalK OB fold domain
MNLATAKLVREDGGPAVTFADHQVPIPQQTLAERPELERYLDREVIIGIRPSSFEDAAFVSDDRPVIKADVTVSEELGSEVNVIFTVHAPAVHHEVMVAKFDKAAKDEVEAEELVGPARACGPPGSTPRPARARGALSTWPSTPPPCTSSTPKPAKPLATSTPAATDRRPPGKHGRNRRDPPP